MRFEVNQKEHDCRPVLILQVITYCDKSKWQVCNRDICQRLNVYTLSHLSLAVFDIRHGRYL
jgi:hypothetical protein